TENKGPGKWRLWQDDPLGTCALWWRWQVGLGDRDGGALPPGLYHQLRYEDLVTDPPQELGKIASFLELPYSESMANYHSGKTRRQSGLSAKAAWLPPVQGLRDWREEMSPEDVGVFEGIAGDMLTRFGYECLERRPNAAVARRVSRCLQWWDREGGDRR
ncbi:MAG: sulfotransferase domain-containing protein, partial [Halioglobus sp.]|nr:sulfotransferase domain-containing protein [Halioglobus sp.]